MCVQIFNLTLLDMTTTKEYPLSIVDRFGKGEVGPLRDELGHLLTLQKCGDDMTPEEELALATFRVYFKWDEQLLVTGQYELQDTIECSYELTEEEFLHTGPGSLYQLELDQLHYCDEDLYGGVSNFTVECREVVVKNLLLKD